ncbi:nuclease-related domain-containing protein [Pseudidiomarina sp.]|uniref:nuclease-related domain-containing protein n=1 Tax=Pseudidiomarina sp. TaxID=2081707 RepID=UPI003A97C0C1
MIESYLDRRDLAQLMEWLSSLSASLLVVLLYLLPLFLLAGIALYTKRMLSRNRTSPLGSDLLRPAGYSLQKSVDDLQLDLMESFVAIPLMSSSMPLILLVQEKLLGKTFGWSTWGLVAIAAACVVGYYIYKAVAIVKKLARLRLGLACEMAVGQELEQIIRPEGHPYRIFHDLPFEGFNVDHLVVSPNGVFIIETKGRSKLVLDGKKQARVRLEGDALHFPTHVETKPLEQVRMNVKAVRNWLNQATGFDVPVSGVLVLPGWYIERKQRATDPYVLSAKELPSQLPRLHAGSLELGQVQAIGYQVSQRVRNVDRTRAK